MHIELILTPAIPAVAAVAAIAIALSTPSPIQLQSERPVPIAREQATIAPLKLPMRSGLQIPVDVLRVIDGDTLEIRAMIWPDLQMNTRLRLRGIDAPERRGKCSIEITLAEAAARRAENLIKSGTWLVTEVSQDKYGGRMVGRLVSATGVDLGEQLMAEGLARAYSGRGKRESWC